jgi:hypothetical protein
MAQVALEAVTGLTATITRNRVTAGRAQLRLSQDLLWYPYAMPDEDWEPAGPPEPDPTRAVQTL